jgi:DNA-binding NarL/FixJ family response regulator
MITRSRILIADDNTLMAELCRRMLDSEFDVIGIVSDGRSLLEAAFDLRPDLILLEVALPMLNGLEAGERIKDMLPSTKLLYLTMNADDHLAVEAFTRGASGYLLKTCSAAELLFAIGEVIRGNTYLSRTLSRDSFNFLRWQNKDAVNEEDRLTHRQREVLQLLAEGKGMKEVGFLLNMTTRTVAFHKYRIMEVLGTRTNAALVRYAVRTHMVKN